MLRELTIRQFAIIDELRIEFDQGFHVLTGETGAGKSILIDALGLIMGGRASSEFVRHGAKKAEIEAVFEVDSSQSIWNQLEDWDVVDEEGILLIRRDISPNGKSTCRINGRLVTVSMLRQIGPKLLNICGQHEHQSLLHIDEHLAWLDKFAGEEVRLLRKQYQEKYRLFRQIEKEIAELKQHEESIEQQLDYYQYQYEEITAASLVEGEDEELEQEKARLTHMEKLISHTSLAYELLEGEGKGLDHVRQAMAEVEKVAKIDSSLQSIHEMIQSSYYQLEEATRQLGSYHDTLEFEPERLNEVQERLYLIEQLKRKYGRSIKEIYAYQQKIKRKLDQLTSMDTSIEELTAERDQRLQECQELADQLTSLRKKAAQRLEARVEKELSELNMGSTVFHVAFVPTNLREISLGETGQDEIEFQIAPNPGEPLKSLNKIASGGELSRIMLALECIFTDMQPVQTIVFDEIDTGVSGRTAQAIAERIALLAKKNQVLCVTHLPQVACMADRHYSIYKKAENDQTRAYVKKLDRESRTLELARMLGGVEVTEKTRQHAEEMLQLATKIKHG